MAWSSGSLLISISAGHVRRLLDGEVVDTRSKRALEFQRIINDIAVLQATAHEEWASSALDVRLIHVLVNAQGRFNLGRSGSTQIKFPREQRIRFLTCSGFGGGGGDGH